jgi:hypothetical protein
MARVTRQVLVVDLPGLRAARSALAQHGGLLSSALRQLVVLQGTEARHGGGIDQAVLVENVISALDLIIERDFRGEENRGTS